MPPIVMVGKFTLLPVFLLAMLIVPPAPTATALDLERATAEQIAATRLIDEAQARRLVFYRSFFGPFVDRNWVLLVPGVPQQQLERLLEYSAAMGTTALPQPAAASGVRRGNPCDDRGGGGARAVLGRIAQSDPELAQLLGAPPPSIDILTASLRDLAPPGTRMIEYMLDGEMITAWVLTANGYKARRWRAPGIERSVGELWRTLARYEDAERTNALLEELHALLIEPIGDLIVDAPLLYFVSDGPLYYVPFQALRERASGRHLIERHLIAYLPTAPTIEIALLKGGRAARKIRALTNPVAVGHSALPGAELEGRIIASHFQDSVILTGRAATEAAAKRPAERGTILHFAAHASLAANAPGQGAIHLAAGEGEDGDLTIPEIFQMKLERTSAAILSGCRTAADAAAGGDGNEIVALSRAFLYAGSPTIIATFWDVRDESAMTLMGAFYRHLTAGKSKSEALALAQREMIASRQHRHPSFWAAYHLIGDYR